MEQHDDAHPGGKPCHVDAVKDGDARTARELIAHQLQELYSEAGIELDQAANTPNGMPGDPL